MDFEGIRNDVEEVIDVFEEKITEAKRMNPDYYPTNIQIVFKKKYYYMVACEPDDTQSRGTIRPEKKWMIGDNSYIFWLDAYPLKKDEWKGQAVREVWLSSEFVALFPAG